MTASQCLPLSASSCASRSPFRCTSCGNKPALVLPRLNRVTECPSLKRQLDDVDSQKFGAPEHQDAQRSARFTPWPTTWLDAASAAADMT